MSLTECEIFLTAIGILGSVAALLFREIRAVNHERAQDLRDYARESLRDRELLHQTIIELAKDQAKARDALAQVDREARGGRGAGGSRGGA